MNQTQRAKLNNLCVNLNRINFVKRFDSGLVTLHFADEVCTLADEDAEIFWNYYTHTYTVNLMRSDVMEDRSA